MSGLHLYVKRLIFRVSAFAAMFLGALASLQAQPVITSISPTAAVLGSSGLTLTVTGQNFTGASIVRWNGQNRSTAFLGPTMLTASIPATDLAGLASASITVSPGSNSAIFTVYREFPLATSNLIYDRVSRRIFASVRGATAAGNSIIPIDPFTEVLGAPVNVGSEPAGMAISQDGQSLYVSLDGAAAVRQLAPGSMTPGLQFWLGTHSAFGPNYSADMEVLPGNPSVLAISGRDFSGNPNYSVAIYDNGVKRSVEVPRTVGPSRIVFSDSASTLYGYDGNRILTMSVNASGVAVTGIANGLSFLGDIEFDHGLIYSTSGTVFDPQAQLTVGTFSIPGLANSVVSEFAMDRVFFITIDGVTATIYAFNRTTFALVGSMTVPAVPVFGSLSKLVRWGDDGLAFSDGNSVFLLRVPKSWFAAGPALTVSSAALVFPVQTVGTTSAAKAISVMNNTNSSIAITSITAAGNFAQTNTCGVSISAFGSCTVNVTFTPTLPGTRMGIVTIVDGSAGSPHVIGLSGIGNASNPVPVITAISPTGVAAGAAGFTLTVTGAKFVSGSIVRWNGVSLPTIFVNSSTLTASVTSSRVAGLESSTVTVFNPSPDGGTSNAAIFTVYRTLQLTANDLLYDRYSRKIYASVPGRALGGNSILTIDPFTATLGSSVWIGSEPGKLAISDNGQYLYAALDGAAAVRRFELASQTAGLQFSLGNSLNYGPYYVQDMEVLPGSPAAVAISRKVLPVSDGTAGVVVYDDGVQRSAESSSSHASTTIAFSDSAAVLYGAEVDSSNLGFNTLSVDAGGVTTISTTPLPVAHGGEIKFVDGRIYGPFGAVVDPVVPRMMGTFTSPVYLGSQVLPDSILDRVFFLSLESSGTATSAVLQAFDRTTFTLVGTLFIPDFHGDSVTSLVRWGDDALAFLSTGSHNRLVLVRIPQSWFTWRPVLSVSPASLLFPPQAVGTASAPLPISLTNNTNASLAITSINTTGDFVQSNDCGVSIAAFSTCTVVVTFMPSLQGTRTGILTIIDAAPGSPHTVALSGIGNASLPVPSIRFIYPDHVDVGSPGFMLTVDGSNFVSSSIVRWNGTNRPTTFVDNTRLTASIPASDLLGLDAASITVFTPPPDGGSSNPAIFSILRKLTLRTNDLIYDPFQRRIYASIPGTAVGGNSIVSIDPFAATTNPPVWIGSEPRKLALSDNGQYLYVALSGAGAVRRMDVATQTPGLQFSLGNNPSSGPNQANEIEVLPRSPESVAVQYGPVGVFDNGVRRPLAVITGTGALSFSDSASILYGAGASSFRTMSVNAKGVTAESTTPYLMTGSDALDIKFDAGRIYSTSGAVVDPINLKLEGRLTLPSVSNTSMALDSSMDRVFFLSFDLQSTLIQAYKKSDFTLVGTLRLTGISPGDATSLVRWGDDGLAFRFSDRVYLMRIPTSWYTSGPVLTVSPAALAFLAQPLGVPSFPLTVILSNKSNAPIAINNIAITGDFSQSNSCGSMLAALATCSIDVTFTPTLQGIRTGTLAILDASPGSPHILGLTGIGNFSFPVPLVTGVSPFGVPVGSAGFTLTVSGGNFVSSSVVRWNGVDLQTTFINSTMMTAAVPAGNLTSLDTAAITVFNPAPDGGVSNAAAFTVYRVLFLTTKDLIYDSGTQRIYASIPGTVAEGNSIRPIDPFTGTLGTPVPIGNDPTKLALSDDGQYLYVSVNGNDVRRMDVASQTAGLQFSLGSEAGGSQSPYGVQEMDVMPGNPSTLAVARKFLTHTGMGGVAIYDDDIKRPVETAGAVGSLTIAFPNSAAILYGVGEQAEFRTMSVNVSGVTVTDSVPHFGTGNDIRFDNGRLYSNAGKVVDPVNKALLGTFNLAGSFAMDSGMDRVFFLTGTTQFAGVTGYDRATFTPVGTLTVPGIVGFNPNTLVRWGEDGLAFRTDTQVFLIRIPGTWFTPQTNRRRGQLTSQ